MTQHSILGHHIVLQCSAQIQPVFDTTQSFVITNADVCVLVTTSCVLADVISYDHSITHVCTVYTTTWVIVILDDILIAGAVVV